MPNREQDPKPDPMIGEVERLLRQLDPPEEPGQPGKPRAGRPRPGQGAQPGSVASPPTFWLPTPNGVWARVALGVVLTAGMTQWPYQTCGWPLLGYLAGVLVMLVAGGWGAYASWRRRMGVAHIVSIALVFAAAVFASGQLLPRIGYAAVKIPWRCGP